MLILNILLINWCQNIILLVSISSANVQTNTLSVLYIFNKSLGSNPFKFYQENQQYCHD